MNDGPLNGMAQRIAWGNPADPPPPVLPEILRPRLGEALEIVLLDAQARDVWLHWTGKRSVPHLKGPEGCRHCLNAEPAKQYAYISAWFVRRNTVGLAEVTTHALTLCPEVLQPSSGRPLRGRHAILSRAAGHRSAKCFLRLLEALRPEPLPRGLDVHTVLEHLWGFDPQTRAALGLDPIPGRHKEEESDGH